jgi:hypothetical protein
MADFTDTRILLTWSDSVETYLSDCGLTMKREADHPMSGRAGIWVLRDGDGRVVDFDVFRRRIAERQKLQLIDEFTEAARRAKAEKA